MGFTALVLAMAVAGQDQSGLDVRLDQFSASGDRASSVVKQLAEKSGENLLVQRELMNEPIFAEVRGKTVREVMSALATATYGQWTSQNGAITLSLSGEAREKSNRMLAERNQKLIANLQRSIDDLKKSGWGQDSAREYVDRITDLRKQYRESAQTGEGDRPTIEVAGPSPKGVERLVLGTIMEQLTPSLLVNLKFGEKVVYSSAPNRLQKRYPADIRSVVNLYAKAHQEIFDESSRNVRDDFGADWRGSLGLPSSRTLNITKLIATVMREDRGWIVGFQLVDPEGVELAYHSLRVTPSGLEAELPNEKDSQAEQGEPIPLSALSQEFLTKNGVGSNSNQMSMGMEVGGSFVLLNVGNPVRPPVYSAALWNLLANPGKVDFLNVLIPELLKHKFGERSFVAVVPDEVWQRLVTGANRAAMREEFAIQALSDFTEEVEEDGFSIVRAQDPMVVLQSRVNRDDMQRLTSAIHGRGFAKVAEVADYASKRGIRLFEQLPDMMVFALSIPFTVEDLISTFRLNLDLADYIVATPEFKANAELGSKTWIYGQMNPGQREAYERMLFTSTPTITQDSGSFSISVSMGERPAEKRMAVDREPTEQFGMGIPNVTEFSMEVKPFPGVLGKVKNHPNGSLMTAAQLGGMIGFGEGSTGEFQVTQFDEFYQARVSSIQFVDPVTRYSIQMADGVLVSQARALKFNDLGSDILSKAEEARKLMREAAKNMGRPRQNVPPNDIRR
jgi:hypothetical protein